MKKSIYLLIAVMCSGFAFSQPATLVFKTTEAVDVRIYQPIDNVYNSRNLISNEFQLKPNYDITYRVDVTDFAYVLITYSDGKSSRVLLMPGDKMEILHNPQGLVFQGRQAKGQTIMEKTYGQHVVIDSILNINMKNGVDIIGIHNDIDKLIYHPFDQKIKKAVSKRDITKECGEILTFDFRLQITDFLVIRYISLLSGDLEHQPTSSDSVLIYRDIDSIYAVPYSHKNMLNFSSGYFYLTNYYYHTYMGLSKAQKDSLLSGYSEDTFGPYALWLLSPEQQKIPALCASLITQLNYAYGEYDIDKMYHYLMSLEHKDQYEYISLVDKKYKEKQKETLPNKIVQISKTVNSFEQLISLPELKGKRLFIDIWSLPCANELIYASVVDSLAKLHDVSLVYISIDNPEDKSKWENVINQRDLAGYHILANYQFKIDLWKIIFKNEGVGIPCYVFIDETGKIVTVDAPRPSSYTELEKLFKK